MTITVKHEPPSQRLQYRVSVPITIEIAGHFYQAVDWSVADFKIANYNGPAQPGELIAARVIIPFQGFDVGFQGHARVIDIDNEKRTTHRRV